MKLVALPAFTDNYIWMLHDGRGAVVAVGGFQSQEPLGPDGETDHASHGLGIALARRALTGTGATHGIREPRAAYGFKPFAADGKIVSNETIDDLRDREGV